MSKQSNNETLSETEILNQIEEDFKDDALKQKFSTKKQDIEELIEENNKMNQELENTKKENSELKSKMKDGDTKAKTHSIKFSTDSFEPKTTSGGKKAIRKGESKIVRQKTG